MSGLLLDTSGSFWQALFSNRDTAIIYGFYTIMALTVALTVISYTWRIVTRIRADADLKQSMIERGMSAEEIERVLKAKSSDK
jgi:hypothetical protein